MYPWYGNRTPGTMYDAESRVGNRVYMRGGRVAHVLEDHASANSNDAALCGRAPWPELWRGTGNQTERGMAKDLPLCVGCRRVLEEIARHRRR